MGRKKLSSWERGFNQGFSLAVATLASSLEQPDIAWELCHELGMNVRTLMAVADEADRPGLGRLLSQQMAEERKKREQSSNGS